MSAETPIITSQDIPGPNEVRRPTPGLEERWIPANYLHGEGEPHENLIRNLSDLLRFGDVATEGARAHLNEVSYRTAREIGDTYLWDVSPKAFKVVDRFRDVRIRFHDSQTSEMKEGNVSGVVYRLKPQDGFVGHEQSLGLRFEDALADSAMVRLAQSRLEPEGVEVKTADLCVLELLRLAAHEAAHVIHGSINKEMKYQGMPEGDNASTVVLSAHPERSLTSDPTLDARMYNERFAEGYAKMVLRVAAVKLGYDESSARAVVRALEFRDENVLKEEPLGEGYIKSLSEEQVASDLEEIADIIQPNITFETESAQISTEVSPFVSEVVPHAEARHKLGGLGLKVSSLLRRG